MHFAGIDIGSTMTKTVIIDAFGHIVARVVGQTGPEHRRLANSVMQQALSAAGLAVSDVSYVVATGYGRINVPFADAQTTELTCHAKGVSYFVPSVGTAIDVGGQDAKALRIKDGKLVRFVMNDKCAAGTGRFLEVLAEALGITLDDLGPLSLRARNSVTISNTCTIFAQQEIVAQMSSDVAIEDIIAGVHDAVAGRIVRMARNVQLVPDVVLTGGVAKNVGFVKAVEKSCGQAVLVPEDPLITGALGAALDARDRHAKAVAKGGFEPRARDLREVRFFT